MATFSINLVSNGSEAYTPTVLRNPATLASGGTTVTLPPIENNLNGASTTTTLIGTAIWTAVNAMYNAIAASPTTLVNESWYISIIDDGSQNYSIAVRFGGTAASGGTSLTIPVVENNLNGASTNSTLESAVLSVCRDAILNSISTSGV